MSSRQNTRVETVSLTMTSHARVDRTKALSIGERVSFDAAS